MSPILNPHVAIRYEKLIHKELLIEHMRKATSKEQMLSEWKQLLDGSGGEASVQKFIERYPYLLPGLYDYHNGPCRGMIISQFPFGADYRADFAFVTVNSMMLQFTFVEIEDPAKPIFNEDFSFSQAFNKALQQVRDWKGWAENNKDILLNMFADLFVAYDVRNDYKSVRCYLVCGRREAVEVNQRALVEHLCGRDRSLN